MDELPEEAAQDKATFHKIGPKANITFPLRAGGGVVFGALAFGKITEDRPWPENQIQRLRLFAQVLANALLRSALGAEAAAGIAEIKQLKERLLQENVYLRKEASLLHDHDHVVGHSPALKQTLVQVEQVAHTDATVLLLGETGAGKELMATAIHNLSSRRDRTMVKVNCAALPATLVESELFGREKGAYTGACPSKSAASSWPTARPSSWTRSAICRRRCRSSCCACCRRASWSTSAVPSPSM